MGEGAGQRTGQGPGEGGFTLLEVLVAFAVLALALAALSGGALGGLRTTAIAGHYDDALARARSRLEAVVAPVPGVTQGDDGGGFRWQTQVALEASESPPRPQGLMAGLAVPGPRLALFDVRVTVSWRGDGGERRVVLDTRRLGLAEPAPP